MKIRIASEYTGSDTTIEGYILINGQEKEIMIQPEGKRDKRFKYAELIYVNFIQEPEDTETSLFITLDDKTAMKIRKHYTK